METKKQTIRLTIIAILLITLFCAAIVPKTFQNDTYYTIKIGEYILENGITMKDPFSWHENLDYTFPHWAYDVATYLIYNIGGFDRSIHSNNNAMCNFRINIIFYKCKTNKK